MARTADRQFWDEVKQAFSAVLEAGASAREAALDAHCAGRSTVRREVEMLLAAHLQAGAFIVPDTAGIVAALGDADAADALAGSRIGAFRLIERIAEGGMGAVYRAERADGDFSQQVAVKLIAGRLYGADTLQRFRAERQLLASLQHSNIVALFDGGVVPGGHPYIAVRAAGRPAAVPDRGPVDRGAGDARAAARAAAPQRRSARRPRRDRAAGDGQGSERRYVSAEELSAEIQRHLEGRPVVAREPSIRYLVGKAVGRQKRAGAPSAASPRRSGSRTRRLPAATSREPATICVLR